MLCQLTSHVRTTSAIAGCHEWRIATFNDYQAAYRSPPLRRPEGDGRHSRAAGPRAGADGGHPLLSPRADVGEVTGQYATVNRCRRCAGCSISSTKALA
jgi:hypothetical protein